MFTKVLAFLTAATAVVNQAEKLVQGIDSLIKSGTSLVKTVADITKDVYGVVASTTHSVVCWSAGWSSTDAVELIARLTMSPFKINLTQESWDNLEMGWGVNVESVVAAKTLADIKSLHYSLNSTVRPLFYKILGSLMCGIKEVSSDGVTVPIPKYELLPNTGGSALVGRVLMEALALNDPWNKYLNPTLNDGSEVPALMDSVPISPSSINILEPIFAAFKTRSVYKLKLQLCELVFDLMLSTPSGTKKLSGCLPDGVKYSNLRNHVMDPNSQVNILAAVDYLQHVLGWPLEALLGLNGTIGTIPRNIMLLWITDFNFDEWAAITRIPLETILACVSEQDKAMLKYFAGKEIKKNSDIKNTDIKVVPDPVPNPVPPVVVDPSNNIIINPGPNTQPITSDTCIGSPLACFAETAGWLCRMQKALENLCMYMQDAQLTPSVALTAIKNHLNGYTGTHPLITSLAFGLSGRRGVSDVDLAMRQLSDTSNTSTPMNAYSLNAAKSIVEYLGSFRSKFPSSLPSFNDAMNSIIGNVATYVADKALSAAMGKISSSDFSSLVSNVCKDLLPVREVRMIEDFLTSQDSIY